MKIQKLEEKKAKLLEKKVKLEVELEKVTSDIKHCDNEIKKLEEEKQVIELKDLIASCSKNGLDINMLKKAVESGDFLTLQEDIESKAN